jgi:hypothetical protein
LKFINYKSRFQKILSILFLFFAFGCSSLNKKNEANYSLTNQPKEFSSPLVLLDKSRDNTELSGVELNEKINFNSKEWNNYSAHRQNWETLFYEQQDLEDQLLDDNAIHLKSGRSYSFDLESFCIDPYKESPYSGDGLKIGSLPEAHQNWMPELLSKYSSLGLKQEEVQTLIWALVSDTKFDELSHENQKNLLKVFPDAMIRFGNRRLENLAQDALREFLPEKVSSAIDEIKKIRGQFLNLQSDFKALEKIMVPPSKQIGVQFNQWMEFEEGYFVKLTAFGYKNVRIDVYVPEDQENRKPQGLKEVIFSVKKLLGIPVKGQRLAISSKSKEKQRAKDQCEQLSKYRAPSCHEMTSSDRDKILNLADPKNFPNTRYSSPPSPSADIESETDCSHFVEEIYKRAGFEYPYTSTGEMSCLGQTFEMDSEENASPGDLILYKGHIGILDREGKVISATRGGEENRSKLDPTNKRFLPSITKNNKIDFGKNRKVLKWKCQ